MLAAKGVFLPLERFVRAMAWRDAGGGRDEEMCKDICAETIAIAYEQFASLRTHEALLSYCFTIATRLHRTYRIKSRRVAYSLSEFAFAEAGESVACERKADILPDDTAEYLTEQSTDVAMLYTALDTLPSEQREAVIMFEILGFSMKEIAEVQKRSVTSVKVSVSRGRTLLAKRLTAR